jgi:FCD domain-containing protein
MTADSKQLARTEVSTEERISTRVVAHLCTPIDSGNYSRGSASGRARVGPDDVGKPGKPPNGGAVERSTSKHLAELAEEVAEMYGTLNDPGRYSIHDVRFHRTIARAAGNAILDALLETRTANVYESRPVRPRSSRHLSQVAEVHREIYRAIRSRNPSRAKILMQQLSRETPENEGGDYPSSI